MLRNQCRLALFCLLLLACSSRDEQAVRHQVLAELIERQKLTEDRIAVRSVRFTSDHSATVEADVLEPSGRAGAWRAYRCELSLEADRWVVRQIGPLQP